MRQNEKNRHKNRSCKRALRIREIIAPWGVMAGN